MDTRRIERVVAVADSKEPGTLLKSLRAQTRNLQQRLTTTKWPGGVAVSDDCLCQRCRHPGNAREQRHGCGVQINADCVHGVFHHRIEAARERPRRDVVLVLADADRLRFDLDQFGQWVLQSPGDRYCTSQRYIHVRQFM